MSVERFSAWYFAQTDLVQLLVLFGPPLLVSVVIASAMGGRLRLMGLAWLNNPTVAGALDASEEAAREEAEGEWTHDAKAAVDDLVARRSRGLN